MPVGRWRYVSVVGAMFLSLALYICRWRFVFIVAAMFVFLALCFYRWRYVSIVDAMLLSSARRFWRCDVFGGAIRPEGLFVKTLMLAESSATSI